MIEWAKKPSHKVKNHEKMRPQSRQSARLFLQPSTLELPSPFGTGGWKAHSLAGEGVGGVPIPTRVHTLWCSIYKYFVDKTDPGVLDVVDGKAA
jgi:hypothetical protein